MVCGTNQNLCGLNSCTSQSSKHIVVDLVSARAWILKRGVLGDQGNANRHITMPGPGTWTVAFKRRGKPMHASVGINAARTQRIKNWAKKKN